MTARSTRWLAGGVAVLAVAGVVLVAAVVQHQRENADPVKLWQGRVAEHPDDVQVVASLATAYGQAGQFAQAYDTLQRVRVLQPKRPGLSCALAMARAARDHLDDAWVAQQLPQLCAASPQDRWSAARAFLKARDPRARVLIEELDMGPDRSKAAAAAAGLALQQKDFASALTLVELATQWGAPVETVVLTHAIALLELSQFDAAMKVTETPVSDEKLHYQLQGVRAGALSKLGRADEAEELFRQSMQRLRDLGEHPAGP